MFFIFNTIISLELLSSEIDNGMHTGDPCPHLQTTQCDLVPN